jgi:hypothetical protein
LFDFNEMLLVPGDRSNQKASKLSGFKSRPVCNKSAKAFHATPQTTASIAPLREHPLRAGLLVGRPPSSILPITEKSL